MSNQQRTPSSIVCENCGGHLDIDEKQEIIECPFCNTKHSLSELLHESDTVRAERIKSQTEKELESARMQQAAEKEQKEEEKAAVTKFKKGKFSKVLIICAIISALVAGLEFSGGFSMAGVIALAQTGLYVTAWLMGMHVIPEKIKNMRVLIAVIAFILIIPFFMFFGNSNDSSYKTEPEKFAWSDIEMHEFLPEPEKTYGEISYNSKDALSMTLCKVEEKSFKSYRDACIAAGYTIEADETPTTYSAYNSDGYNVRLIFTESNEELTVYLDAPEEMDEFEWPTNGLGSMLPATNSTIGDISWDNSETFIVHVGNTTIDEYKEYVKACEAEGFTIDYSKDDEYYNALNAEGYELTLRYLGFNKIEVALHAPDKTEEITEPLKDTEPTQDTKPTEATEPTEEVTTEPTTVPEDTKPSIELVDGLRPDFKKAMDSYEEFFDEYCGFMKKYSSSDGSDLTLLVDYATYTGKYAKMMKDFEAWEDEEMNDAETAYYIKVQNRINKKLLEVAQ